VVLALGKAACAMAEPVAAAFGPRVRAGLAITKDGHARPLPWPVRETAHPVPDLRCPRAANEALELACSAAPDEVLLVLLSGGASALTACPAEGLSLEDLAETTRCLLACGADILETNAVRKHLSAFAGGQLARACRAGRIEVWVVSDVPGDALDVIGSGPCAPDPTTFSDALAVVERYGIGGELPVSVLEHLRAGAAGDIDDTPASADAIFERVRHTVIASNADAREAAAAEASRQGLEPVALGECLEGEARDRAVALVDEARARRGGPRKCLIAGGETTVTLLGAEKGTGAEKGRGKERGKGGRSQELALAAAIELSRHPEDEICLLAAGTDGSDGPTDAAGAFADGQTLTRASTNGLDAARALERNDAYPFFDREGGLVRTGPTGTNVMDLVLIEV
jgi:glycerate-2-kinase